MNNFIYLHKINYFDLLYLCNAYFDGLLLLTIMVTSSINDVYKRYDKNSPIKKYIIDSFPSHKQAMFLDITS